MMLSCPWCGPRNATEFRYLGESRARPDPADVTVEDWRRYLYFRDNVATERAETWYHRMGCRQYLSVVRDPVDNTVRSVRPARDADRLQEQEQDR